MSANYEIHEWIDRYLNGQMSPSELTEFESQLQSDEALRITFEAQKVANQVIIGQELLQLKSKISKDLNIKGSNGSGSGNTGYFIGSIVVVATAIILYLLLGRQENGIQTSEEVIGGTKNADTLSAHDKSIEVNKAPISTATDSSDVSSVESKPEDKSIVRDTIIEFSCQAKAACVGDKNGMIEIDVNTIKQGKAPYTFSISPYGDFQEEPILTDLKSEKYSVYVKDSKDKVRRLYVKVEVPEVPCSNTHK